LERLTILQEHLSQRRNLNKVTYHKPFRAALTHEASDVF